MNSPARSARSISATGLSGGRRKASQVKAPTTAIMAIVANTLSNCSSAWPDITCPRGIEISDSKPNLSDRILATNPTSSADGRKPLVPIKAPPEVLISA
jgi:hypothetical protein